MVKSSRERGSTRRRRRCAVASKLERRRKFADIENTVAYTLPLLYSLSLQTCSPGSALYNSPPILYSFHRIFWTASPSMRIPNAYTWKVVELRRRSLQTSFVAYTRLIIHASGIRDENKGRLTNTYRPTASSTRYIVGATFARNNIDFWGHDEYELWRS